MRNQNSQAVTVKPQAITLPPGMEFEYVDVPFNYTYNTTLPTNQSLNGQVVPIYPDADFMLRGFVWASTLPFSIQLQDGEGYYLSSDLVDCRTMPSTPGDPFPFYPEVKYYAGGRLFFNLANFQDFDTEIRFLFTGVSRYSKR